MAPGVGYDRTGTSAKSEGEAFQRLLAATNGTSGYTVSQAGPGVLVCTRQVTAAWVPWTAGVGIALAVLGLLADFAIALIGVVVALGAGAGLLFKRQESLTVAVARTDAGTQVTTHGVVSPELKNRLDLAFQEFAPAKPPMPSSSPATRSHVVGTVSNERVSILSTSEKARLAMADSPSGAGWNPDPLNPAQERYWNGNQWTGRTRSTDTAPTSSAGHASAAVQEAAAAAAVPSAANAAVEAPSGPVLTDKLLSDLARLNELRKAGGLTDEEFEDLKRQALGK